MLAEDSQDRSKWHTSEGGIYYAIGIGGSVLGRGADIPAHAERITMGEFVRRAMSEGIDAVSRDDDGPARSRARPA